MINGLLGDLPEFQKEMQGMQIFQRPPEQPQRQAPAQGNDVSFLEKMAIFLAPTAYQNIQNVKSMRQQQSKQAQAQQQMQQAVQANPDDFAKAASQLYKAGNFTAGDRLLAIAKQRRDMRDKLEAQDLGDSRAMVNPYTGQEISRLGINVSPDSQLTADTAIRGQDIGAVTSRRGQDISADTTRRGQDIGATTTRRGQDITQGNKAPSGGNLSSSAGEIASSLGRVGRLLGETGTTGLSGRLIGATGLPTDRKALESELESLQSQLAFAEIARLKGEGVTFGALSDPERIAIGRSVANLDPNQPEDALRAQLQRVYDKFKQYQPDSYASMGGFMKQKSNRTRGQGGGFKVIGRE